MKKDTVGAKAEWAIGMMSGTSMDGVDAALLKTDGTEVQEFGPALSIPYDPGFREQFRACLGQRSAPAELVAEFTRQHAALALDLLDKSGLDRSEVRAVGFHGQTLYHEPENGITVQVGDGQLLADLTGIDVVADFRTADVQAGGEGAPLAPLYHRALASGLDQPVAVLNLGGVANVTWLDGEDIIAFDTGPASAMIDDWVMRHTGQGYDAGGALARSGTVDAAALEQLLDNPYFDRKPPKSLDRDDFSAAPVAHLSPADGAATLTAFTIQSIARAGEHLSRPPRRWLVTGGGRHNNWIMERLSQELGVPVEPVEAVNWRGDELEAEAFAFLAVRSLNGQPLSLPQTTGVRAPMQGGVLFRPQAGQAGEQEQLTA
ncbi:anhydro-N-acetylmuramic acid kinase [Sneathiella chinensis]|uniref:Anhydro-N-acetylmuramic acid kinase n=1 Tax=Sneathiella chinensis TaxID=349750 RepID=A0ABQ5U614_9PROT|nr:anhydro-N-acetylmuramic acid kinase [Sneathiella chinensis]GLQ07552.1 anhydro-N-acetylmuramic acid kinase [Sneathiella chinensis]